MTTKYMLNVAWWKSDLCGGKHCVLVQTEHGLGGDGVVGQKAAAYHLVWLRQHKQTWLSEIEE